MNEANNKWVIQIGWDEFIMVRDTNRVRRCKTYLAAKELAQQKGYKEGDYLIHDIDQLNTIRGEYGRGALQ